MNDTYLVLGLSRDRMESDRAFEILIDMKSFVRNHKGEQEGNFEKAKLINVERSPLK